MIVSKISSGRAEIVPSGMLLLLEALLARTRSISQCCMRLARHTQAGAATTLRRHRRPYLSTARCLGIAASQSRA